MAKKEYGTRKEYHFIYRTTNLLSGRYYIGMHSTDNLNDGYLGSGTLLRRSINKHGKENFKIEILEFLNSREELAAREEEIVSLQEIAKKECMNLKVGGRGGLSTQTHRDTWIKAGKAAITLLEQDDPEFKKKRREKAVETLKRLGKYEEFSTRIVKYRKDWTGLKHSEQTKEKMSNAKKGKGIAQTNSQYGTCWITNEIESKKINKTDPIPEGWRLGRKIK
jgi:hypothetical protein